MYYVCLSLLCWLFRLFLDTLVIVGLIYSWLLECCLFVCCVCLLGFNFDGWCIGYLIILVLLSGWCFWMLCLVVFMLICCYCETGFVLFVLCSITCWFV